VFNLIQEDERERERKKTLMLKLINWLNERNE